MIDDPTVFVVDNDLSVCESLRYLLESDGLRVETHLSAEEFLKAYRPERPGVLVLDLSMPGMCGAELQERLIDQGFTIPVIILTAHGDVPLAVRTMKAGAVDFLQKPPDDEVLLSRVHDAIERDALNRKQQVEQAVVAERLGLLTPRECEVLDLLVVGKSTKQIANEMCRSVKTIEVHRRSVKKKMRVGSTVALVHMVLSSGVLARIFRRPRKHGDAEGC